MSDLYRRLAEKKARRPEPASDHVGSEEGTAPFPGISGKPESLGGWTPAGTQVWMRTVEAPVDPEFLAAFPSADPGIWCLDTETTGLSGGAGTRAFLAGGCRFNPRQGNLEVVQYFLQDFDGEPHFVELLEGELKASTGIRTYNGGSFDLPLLKNRWILCGREFPLISHRDLLPPARRLWKPLLEKCSLKRVEEGILGIVRRDDVPGEEVPGLYAAYLRKGAGEDFPLTLAGVFSHHVQDVVSLWYLDVLIREFESHPLSDRWSWEKTPGSPTSSLRTLSGDPWFHPRFEVPLPVNPRALLPHLEAAPALELCRKVWRSTGQESWGLAFCRRLEALPELTLGDRMDLSSVLMGLWKERGSLKALIRLLKFLEHREKSVLALQQAFSLVGEALRRPLSRERRQDLEKRRIRLASRLHGAGKARDPETKKP